MRPYKIEFSLRDGISFVMKGHNYNSDTIYATSISDFEKKIEHIKPGVTLAYTTFDKENVKYIIHLYAPYLEHVHF